MSRLDVDNLTPTQKRELLAELLRKQTGAASTVAAVPLLVSDPSSWFEPFQLTDVQRAYWLGRSGMFGLGGVSCHIYIEFDVERLNFDRLGTAWQRLINRHDMLRAIVRGDGQQQVLSRVPPFQIKTLDIRGVDPAEGAKQLEAVRRHLSHQVLPADSWPLFELRTSRLDDRRSRVHVSLDLLTVDFWSIQILLKEWFQLYLEPDSHLEPLEISFRDYVIAAAKVQHTKPYATAEKYWRRRIASLPSPPALPLAINPSSVRHPAFVRRGGVLEADIWRGLKNRALKANLTSSSVVLAAFAEILAAWSNVRRFTINLTLFQRLPLHPKVGHLVGDFTSIVLLEVDRTVQETFEAAANRIQAQLWRDLEHREYGGLRLLQDLARSRGSTEPVSMPVVFTSALVLDSSGPKAPEMTLPAKLVYSVSQTPQVWLDHQVYEQGGRLQFSWDAVEELFPAGLLDDMFETYCSYLERLSKDEAAWKEKERNLLPAQQAISRIAVNETSGPLPNGLLHSPFLEQVRLRPQQTALICTDRRFSYEELYRCSNYWSQRLRELGVQPNHPVAVVMEKGWEQVAAVLAILESGAAYLPVDPDLPEERRNFLLQHGTVKLALTQSWVEERLRWPDGVLRLSVDRPTSEISSVIPMEPTQSPEDLAYVIFTSGSTGSPKGVMIDHRGALNTITDMNERFAVGPTDRILALSSLSFDLSVYDIFGTLACGATILMPDAGRARDAAHWADLMLRERVTVWNSVPALLDMLVSYAGGRNEVVGNSLRLALLSGDWIPVALPDRARKVLEGVEVVSLGGATEASIWSILYRIGDVKTEWKSIPYGRPLRNQQIYVLDETLQPCPTWVQGQIYIGGVGLAKGYWQDESKTNAQFVTHPSNGQRLYRTGDLGRYLPSDDVEFLGREDFQVKVQGYRIELGEIEATLEAHASVRRAVVTVVGEPGAPRHLVAYVVGEASAEELRTYVRTRLPEYMVPKVWEQLEALPLTSNGKIDRTALPPPSPPNLHASQPKTTSEIAVAELWASALGLDYVPVDGNFFELGGDSLRAVQLVTLMQDRLNTQIPVTVLLENPTIRGVVQAIEDIRSQRSLESPPSVESFPKVVPDPEGRSQPFSLTDLQQAYWIGRNSSLELGNVAAHFYIEIDGSGIDAQRLNIAWQKLIERHDMLRAIVLPDGRQRILDAPCEYKVEVLDLQGVKEEETQRQLHATRNRMSHQILPTDQWPLFEIRVTRYSHDKCRIHFSMDLLVVDVWSFRLLLLECLALYQDPQVELPPLVLTFRDYVLALSKLAETELWRSSKEYWMQRLPDLPPTPDLPLARAPSTVVRPRFERRAASLCKENWQKIKDRGRADGLTPSGILLAAFAEILATWSSNRHFTVNLTLFQRLPLHPQVDQIVGDFTSVTLLEVDYTRSESFIECAQRLQKQLWRDLDHRYFSGVRVMRELSQRQRAGVRPMMSVVFTSAIGQAIPGQEMLHELIGDATGELVYSVSQTPQVWLDHQVYEQGGRLQFSWDAVEELFPAGLLDDMFETYCSYLERLSKDEGAWKEKERNLLPAQQAISRIAVNETSGPLPNGLLHTPFLKQVRLRPEQTAIISSERTLTYHELYVCAVRIGSWLRKSGAEPNRLVGVVMEKGWEQIVAVLGVILSGAAFVPIDPELPEERRFYLARNCEINLVLTQSWLRDQVKWPDEVRVQCLDEEYLEQYENEPLDLLQSEINLAYVIFTSGSTGTPKGVMIEHRSALNTVIDVNDRFAVGPEDRILAISSLSFDLSIYDIFGCLAAGGTIVIPGPEARRDPARWAELIEKHRVTIWNSAPALMQMLVEYAVGCHVNLPGSLRLVLLSGDWIPVGLPDQIRSLVNMVKVVSLGGATEASIWSVLYPIEKVEPDWKSIPYGRPMRNQKLVVLNEAMEPCPVWVPGNIYIGGIGLARGYWRDEDRTNTQFVTDTKTRERLYRTGDRGRYLPDGNIEFLGREDSQVKIQGYRIELEEIVQALKQHPGVRAAVVTAIGEVRGNKRLVAYWVSGQRDAPAKSELKAFLRKKLPDFMVPSEFARLDDLPLTKSGKMDRMALSAFHESNDKLEDSYVSPRNQVELDLANIWSTSLGVTRVGIFDNFFQLGGDSIRAIQIIGKAKQAGLRISPRQLFENQTVAELAEVVAATARTQAEQGPVVGRVNLTPILHWFFDQGLAQPEHWNLAVILTMRQRMAAKTLESAFQHLLLHHDALRLCAEQNAGGWNLFNRPPDSDLDFRCIDLSGLPVSEQGAAIEATAAAIQASFNLSRGQLMCVAMFDLGPGNNGRLLIVIHHVAVDAVSFRILLEDLHTIYYQLGLGQEIELSPKTTSYLHWSDRLQEYAHSAELKEELGFWLNTLSNEARPLPIDHDKGPNSEGSIRSITLALTPLETQALRGGLLASHGVMIHEALLGALLHAVLQWTGESSLIVDVLGHGREEISENIDVYRTVGWFSCMYPVSFNVADAHSLDDEIKVVRTELTRIPKGGIGYGLLRFLNQECSRVLRSRPQPQIFFNYFGQTDDLFPEHSLFSVAPESVGPLFGPQNTRLHLLGVAAIFTSGVLRIEWAYSENKYRPTTINGLAQSFMSTLRSLIGGVSNEAVGQS